MELLLALLSLLTAATGAVAGSRAPEAGVHQAANIIAIAPARQVSPRLALASGGGQPRVVVEATRAVVVATPSASPLYADRRRE